MDTPDRGVFPVTDIGAARLSPAPLRFIWPRHARKRIARAFGVSVHTAKDWLRDGVPLERRLELAAVVERELEGIEAELARMREGDE